MQFPATELLRNGGRERGRNGGGEDLHVGGIYQVDVEKNSLPPACSPAWLQFHLYGTYFYFLKDPVLVHNI